MYYDGEGVPQNKVAAYALMILAGMQREDARETRNLVRKQLTPAQIAEGQELAAQLQERISGGQ